jgi:hypothetical protein
MKYLTLDWLRKHKAHREALQVFESRFGTKKATIKEVVDYLHKIKRPDLEVWLLDRTVPLTIAMIEAGANIHVYNDFILRSAASRGWLDMVKCLVEYGVDIHAMDDLVLCLAAIRGHLGAVKYLVEHDANVHARLNFTLKLARRNHHTRTAKFLEKAAALAV